MRYMKEILKTEIDEEYLVKLTSDMIRIESHPDIPCQETKVAQYIKSVFDEHGIDCYLKEIEDGRCNVIACLDSGNPGKTIMLNGHTDTVRAIGMEDAFVPRVEDGKLYGRGASDMKGPIASIIMAMIALKKTGLLKKGKVIFTGVLDEEQKSIGTIDIIESGITADAAVVCEPTMKKIMTGNRGLEWFKFHFIGRQVHGGTQANGVNAISKAVKFINVLEETLIPDVSSRGGTVNYGIIHGGTQLSTVAGTCDLYVDRRFTKQETYEDVVQEFKNLIDKLSEEDPDFKCEMSVQDVSLMKEGYIHPPMEIDANDPFVQMLKKAADSVLEFETEFSFMPAWTDAALLECYGKIPSVLFGPGVIECCHSLNEYIPIVDLSEAALIYALLAIDFCSC